MILHIALRQCCSAQNPSRLCTMPQILPLPAVTRQAAPLILKYRAHSSLATRLTRGMNLPPAGRKARGALATDRCHVSCRMDPMIERARELARTKHAGLHLFDEARTGMFEHISEVAGLVEEQGGSREMITA